LSKKLIAQISAVYDGSGFMKDHPGGGESISLVAGQDAVSSIWKLIACEASDVCDDQTEDFMSIHSPQGRAMLVE
jgi:nitrate reductase (NAD(P)H)